jgi:hypothetical protein
VSDPKASTTEQEEIGTTFEALNLWDRVRQVQLYPEKRPAPHLLEFVIRKKTSLHGKVRQQLEPQGQLLHKSQTLGAKGPLVWSSPIGKTVQAC